jgi:excisionase family DNA binding protein
MDPNDSGLPAISTGEATSPDYETKAQVARRLAVSERTIEAMVADRRIPYIRFTSKILRFPKRDVDAYIAKHLRVAAIGEGGRQ